MRREQSLRCVVVALMVSLPWASVRAQTAKSEAGSATAGSLSQGNAASAAVTADKPLPNFPLR